MDRIPTKLLDYKEMVFWFVADKVEMKDGRPWNKRSQRFIWTGETIEPIHGLNPGPQFIEFYVHPHTNKLGRVEQSIKRKRKKEE